MPPDKNLLLVSSSGGKNYDLASNLKDIVDSKLILRETTGDVEEVSDE